MKTKKIIYLVYFIAASFTTHSQTFLNGDLEGVFIDTSTPPDFWEYVPFDHIICSATQIGFATSDLTNLDGPLASSGINGNPFSGHSFISGVDGRVTEDTTQVFQEGIQQSLSGFTPGNYYSIKFHQAVVKQFGSLDTSGSWAVYLDDNLLEITQPSVSQLPYNSNKLNWEPRSIDFVASSTEHLIRFLPYDDDPLKFDPSEPFSLNGSLRMGIDDIRLDILNHNINFDNEFKISVFPNPTQNTINIESNLNNIESTISLYQLDGKLIHRFNGILPPHLSIDIKGENGIYLLEIETENRISKTYRIVKK